MFAVLIALPGTVIFGLVAGFGSRRQRRRSAWFTVGLFAVAAFTLVSCGGGNSTPEPKSYTVTVTAAASGGIQHTTQVGVTLP
jgi:ABC-type transporter Mla subunit MlaD